MNDKQIYKTYKRGSIIYVDLGKGVGTEFSFKHFCLVISNKDSLYNSKLTVIPLSSKNKYSIKVDYTLLNPYFNKYKELITKSKTEFKRVEKEFQIADECNDKIKMIEIKIKLDHLQSKISDYKTIQSKIDNLINKSSFAKIHDVTTVSKSRIKNYIKTFNVDIRLPKTETDRIVNQYYKTIIAK